MHLTNLYLLLFLRTLGTARVLAGDLGKEPGHRSSKEYRTCCRYLFSHVLHMAEARPFSRGFPRSYIKV